MNFGLWALIVAAVFTGAAIYINVAEQPARLGLDDRALRAQWGPSYKRGFMMQASLAIVGTVFAAIAFVQGLDWRWLVGAVIFFANWPFTLLIIMPVNHRVLAIEPDRADGDTRALIVHWGRLHAVRGLLGLIATAIFAWALT